MKTSLEHLPASKREQIAAIAALIQASAPVEMIILFGSYARGDWVEDLVNLYFSDFDLLVIVATEASAKDDALWGAVSTRAKRIGGRVPVTLLVHDIKEVNHEIRSGQYFFGDILREGVLLYDSRHFQLARPKALDAQERLELAELNFRYWYPSAGGFWRIAGVCAGRGLYPHAAFLLHQATERYFHAALLVFTGYKPKTHDIEDLAVQTAVLHPLLAGALPRMAGEDERLFKLLKRAYIEARYSKSYRITAEELSVLSDRVRDLGIRVREACVDKLSSFCGPGAVGELPPEPSSLGVGELPPAPSLDDPEALVRWRDAILELSFERGEIMRQEGFREGERLGLREGEERGLREGLGRERARAIVDVLRRRGVEISDADADRILTCRDDALLAAWWERAFSANSATEIFDPIR